MDLIPNVWAAVAPELWPERNQTPEESVEQQDSRTTTGHRDPTVALHWSSSTTGHAHRHGHADVTAGVLDQVFRTSSDPVHVWDQPDWWAERTSVHKNNSNSYVTLWKNIYRY